MILWVVIALVLTLVVGAPLWFLVTVCTLTRRARADGVAASFIGTMGLMIRHDHANRYRHSRGGPPPSTARSILETAGRASLAGLEVTLTQVETLALAGGDPAQCVDALIEARARGVLLDWDTALAIDLAGRDPLAAVQAGANMQRLIGSPEYDGMFLKPATAVH